ncbi:integrase, catalytic region, zinc finger, CCHC-type containing protein, partial [Tanacetum coccineum]
LIAENEHLKQTYKQLYDSIKPASIRSKEQCDGLINQVNLNSVEISNLNASLQEKVLVITSLKDELRKLKGKALVDNVVTKHTIDPEMLKNDNLPIGINPSTRASRSQPSGNTKKDKIQQTPSSTQKNKVEAHPRKVKSSLKNKDCVVVPKGTANVQHSKLNVNSELKCVKCNGCMLSDNHDLCVIDFINNVNARVKSKSVKKSSKRKVWKPTGKVFTNIAYIWRPTGRTFTIVGNACPLTRITTTAEVPLRKPTTLESDTPKPVVTLVYSRKPRKPKTNVHVSKFKVLKTISANKKEPSKSWGSIVSDVPSSSLDECRVYYVEGLGHNLFSVGQFYDSNLEVAFRQHTCFIRNLEGVDLLTGSRDNNLYTLSLGDMMASSPICLLSKALKTKSKDKALDFIIKFLNMIQVRLKVPVQRIRTDNGTKFVNQTLREYYEKVGISHETSVARSPQQNGVVERLAPVPTVSTGSPFSTTVDQDAPSPSNSQTTPRNVNLPILPTMLSEYNHDLDVAHMNNDSFFGITIPENNSEASSPDVIPTVVQTAAPYLEHVTK